MRISELEGQDLDRAVAEYLGVTINEGCTAPTYSSDWSFGGPIIEQEKIKVSCESDNIWLAGKFNGVVYTMNHSGPTPLTAAMRCFVASKERARKVLMESEATERAEYERLKAKFGE